MSIGSNESIGVCLSEDKSIISLSGETGEARTGPSISIESLSLTKISIPNDHALDSSIPPLLLTYIEDGETHRKLPDHAPRLLSVTLQQPQESSSGVTPSGTTLEGTLDDIPDFQDIAPPTAVVLNKRDLPDLPTPDSSPSHGQQPSNSPQQLQTSSKVYSSDSKGVPSITPESRFTQEVKRYSSLKAASSVRSVASTTAPKTSTSGITVVEVKNPPLQNVISGGRHHSIGSVCTADTIRNFSTPEESTTVSSSISKSTSRASKKPKESLLSNRIFLLKLPDEPESDQIIHSRSGMKSSRKILAEKIEPNKESRPKTWSKLNTRAKENRSPQTVSITESVSSVKEAKRKRRDVVGEKELKKIVKDEMSAIVTMQNDIWHKILDSFVEKAAEKQRVPSEPPAPSVSRPGKMRMLELPKEDPYYRPLHIPIIRPGREMTSGKPTFLHFPSEEEEIADDGNIERAPLEEDQLTKQPAVLDTPVEAPAAAVVEPVAETCNVSIQTTQQHLIDTSVQFEPGELPVKLPLKTVSQMPLSENVGYQRTVNKDEVTASVMEQCKMLLESIQNSADELKSMKSQPIPGKSSTAAARGTDPNEKTPTTYFRSKHEIFLEQFINPKPPAAPAQFLDVVDIPSTRPTGHHFQVRSSVEELPPTEQAPKEFIQTRDLTREVKKKPPGKPTKRKSSAQPGLTHDPAAVARPTSPHKVASPPPVHHPPASATPETPTAEDTLSSIGKYLQSQHSEVSSDSDGGKTIENEPSVIANETEPEKEESDERAADDFPHALKAEIPDQEEFLTNLLQSEREQEETKPADPDLYGEMIAQTLQQLREHQQSDRQREVERTRQINLLLESRKMASQPAPSLAVRTPRQELQPSAPKVTIRSTRRATGAAQTTKTAVTAAAKTAKPVDKAAPASTPRSVRKEVIPDGGELSMVSSDTSLPTNTEDLLRAALESDTSSAEPVASRPVANRPTVASAPSGGLVKRAPTGKSTKEKSVGKVKQAPEKKKVEEKKELEEWMRKKRLARLQDFKKEREDKIRKEVRPFKSSPVTQRRNSQSGFDRKAAILRRLNMAEELFTDIQKTPRGIDTSTRNLGPRDRTQEWVEGLRVEDFDSIHSPSSLGSEHGASAITENISLP